MSDSEDTHIEQPVNGVLNDVSNDIVPDGAGDTPTPQQGNSLDNSVNIPHGAGQMKIEIPKTNNQNDIKFDDSGDGVRLRNIQREIELTYELSALKEANTIEEERIELNRRVEELSRRQREIEIRAKLQAAKECNMAFETILKQSLSPNLDPEISFKTPEKLNSNFTSRKPVESQIELSPPVQKSQVQYETPSNVKETPVKSDPYFVDLFSKLLETQRDQSLPSQDIEHFDGSDVSLYYTFIKNFEFVVEYNTSDPSRRLTFLLKYTKGEAHDLIKYCPLINPPSKAYEEARLLLKRDYGTPAHIAADILDKADKWKKIASGDKLGLRKFSIFLVNCVNTFETSSDMQSLNSSDFLWKLGSKLPIPLQQRWINEFGKLRERENRSPSLVDFEKFVGVISRNENDPRISGLGYQHKTQSFNTSSPFPNKHSSHSQPHKKVYSTTVLTSKTSKDNLTLKSPCLVCGPGTFHSLSVCRKFKALAPEQKSESVRKNGLCYACLNPGHMKSKCPNPEWSKCEMCSRTHTTLLHDPSKNNANPGVDISNKTESKTYLSSGCVKADIIGSNNPLLAIVPVKVKAKLDNTSLYTYAFIDNGCSALFIGETLVNALKLRCRTTHVVLKTLNLEQNIKTHVVTDTLQISDINGDNFLDLPEAYVKDKLPASVNDAPQQCDIDKWSHLKGIEVPLLKPGVFCIPQVTLMIGINFPAGTTPLEFVVGEIGQPYALRSPIGWLFYGLPGKLSNYISNTINVNYCHLDNQLESQVKRYFNLEFGERLCDDKALLSVEDKRFLNIMDNSVKLVDNHYTTDLPFRDKTFCMPNNQLQAEMFAYKLQKRLAVNSMLHEKYTAFMTELENQNYAERVPANELNRNDGRVWFIPHHNVSHPRKPEKVRIVFNCPLLFNGVSLNSQLLSGPDLTNNLLGVLLRWRQETYAFMADIESMFYQVRVSKHDCDMMRFLWWPGGNINCEPVQYRMLVHLFGAVSSPSCSNYALKRVAKDNADICSPELVNSINNDFYVDDLVKSVSKESDAIDLATDIRNILQTGGFNITKWISNSRELLKTIPQPNRADEVKNLDFDSLPDKRALGVKWSIESDQIIFEVDSLSSKPTRRNILSVMSSVYDPFGFASPFILRAKIILQELCRLKLGWDEFIPVEQETQWKKWMQDLDNIHEISVERCIKPKEFGKIVNVQLHHFADASNHGYGTVTYVRHENQSGEVSCAFVLGRSRVAPLKPHTIVKLELSAATSIVKINSMLMSELTMSVDETYFWTDSQTVLKYIQNEQMRHQVFVANRLAVIRDGSEVSQWNYVPSRQNPADHASRGLSALDITGVNWLSGPEFLTKAKSEWPSEKPANMECEIPISVNVLIVNESVDIVNKLLEKYSDLHKLKRGISWWLRLREILRCKAKNVEIPNELCKHSLSLSEISKAEVEIVKFVQISSYSEEIKCLESDVKNVKLESNISNLDPFLKVGILRVGGRLHNANIPYNAKHQIILPYKCHVSNLIVKYCHVNVAHMGKNHTISNVRKSFWIVKVGVVVKTILSKCVTCKKYQSRLREQKMANIPFFRLKSDLPPFNQVGTDYFGPIEIKVGRTVRKRYGVIFTCLISRAVHLEVSDSLDTSSCVNALRRFISRRGMPSDVYSDNGTNLVGAQNELKQSLNVLNRLQIENFAVKSGFQWHFNPPTASHFGGVWERQIRTVRKILYGILSEQFLRTSQSDEELRTLFCEVESVINSRPLTRVSTDPSDLEVITPNSILLCHQNIVYPPGLFDKKDVYSKRCWRQIQYLTDIFWKRWTEEYLHTMQTREKWINPSKNIQVGDIVLIVDSSAPRGSWPMGVVLNTFPDKNGLVRSVKIRTKGTILSRPIAKLVLILESDN